MVRSLIRRVLGRQDVGVSNAPLELPPSDSRERARAMVMGLQDEICAGLEVLDGEGRFVEESWVRPEGGGGRSRVMREGRVFEQGGVNFSEVQGEELPPSILKQRPEAKGHPWFATGTSMVLHPRNPYIPTVHLNYRYFEAGPVWWFGGGADLTPYYPFLDDARHFHRTHQAACDSVHPDLHKVFKPWCDEYFYLKHRGEARGVGGIFYDYQDANGTLYKGQDPSGPPAQVSARLGARPLSWEQLFSLGAGQRQSLPSRLRPHRGEATSDGLWRSREGFSALSPGPICGVQPGLGPRHDLRSADQWTHRIDPDVPTPAGALGVRLHRRGGITGSPADRTVHQASRLAL